MLFDESPTDISYSTQLFHPSNNSHRDIGIEPWGSEHKTIQRLYSKRESRVSQLKLKERKQSVDERIEQMYKKYKKEGIVLGNQMSPNSRQQYRDQLQWLEKGQQFKQLGGGNTTSDSWQENYTEGNQNEKIGGTTMYCMGTKKPEGKNHSKGKQYRCNQNFQRMLKIKQKLRKKHTHSNYKHKPQHSQSQVQSANRQMNYEVTAKATLERNKLKLKMRGLSKQKISNPQQELSKIHIVGTCSNTYEYGSQLQALTMTTSSHRRNEYAPRPSLPGFMSMGQRQLSR